jgi:glycyl-tRNA synthetase beta chain
MAKLLFEIVCGEIPASMQKAAAYNLARTVSEALETEGVLDGSLEVTELGNGMAPDYPDNLGIFYSYGPRRLFFLINGINGEFGKRPQLQLSDMSLKDREIRGPRIEAPEAAIVGFMKKNNIEARDSLIQKDGFYYYQKPQSQNIEEIIAEKISNALSSYVWPKSMKWGKHKISWVRPIDSLLCLFEDSSGTHILQCKFAHIVSGNKTYGHRFMTNNRVIEIHSISQYLPSLRASYVEPIAEIRKQKIQDEIAQKLPAQHILIEDEKLLDEVVALVEWPVILLGTIEERFMALPEKVLQTTLRNNQKYFLLRRDGQIAPYFIITANIMAEDHGKTIISGNEKVLRARLSDALFFYEQDIAHTLVKYKEGLKKLVFHNQIGSVYEKIGSTTAMAMLIAQALNYPQPDKVHQAMGLAKADLCSQMVKEFPELQGIMGYYYAKAAGDSEDIALAIMEHYKPNGLSDYVPHAPLSVIVALAEKLDTLNQMFAIGIKPTGSKDPYALRRAAIGVLRIVQDNKLVLDLPALGVREDVCALIEERKKHMA